MQKSLGDWLRAVSGEKPRRQTPWRALRGRFWLYRAIWLSDLSVDEFQRTYIHRDRSSSNLVKKWRAGTTLPTRASAVALKKKLPDTLWLFDLPLFPLLADEPISRSKLKRLTQKYIGTCDFLGRVWKLPDHERTPWSSRELVHRGDFWGLFAIIGMMRWAELEGDFSGHVESSKDAFRALSALLRLPWAAPLVPELYEMIERVRRRNPYSENLFRVNWSVIEELARRPDFAPDPADRPHDARGYADTYPDPVVISRFVPARRQERW